MGIARILITAGEPAGIGPEILVKMAQHACNDQLIVCADPSVLKHAAQIAGLPLTLNEFKSEHEAQAHRPAPR